MTIQLNWDSIYRDYLDSGLLISEFYRSRLLDYCDLGQIPSRETFRRHMRRCSFKSSRPTDTKISRSLKIFGDNMQIVELSESSLRCIAEQRTVSTQTSGSQLLRVRFPNGSMAEFETTSPERSVAVIMQAMRGNAS